MIATCIWWNVQRLFRPGGASPIARDLDATATFGWTESAYSEKIESVAAVLRSITGGAQPALIAFAEVENSRVVSDVRRATGWTNMLEATEDRSDLQGYDLSLLYSTSVFRKSCQAKSHSVHSRYATRDIFEVDLITGSGHPLKVLLNHWPSRRITYSEVLRFGMADYAYRLFNSFVTIPKHELTDSRGRASLPAKSMLESKWNSPVLLIGDFNDDPFDISVSLCLEATRFVHDVIKNPRFPSSRGRRGVDAYLRMTPRLFNPSWRLLTQGGDDAPATTYWNGDWYLLDQVVVSRGMLIGDGCRLVPESLHIYSPARVRAESGKVIEVRTRAGYPKAFDPMNLQGVSDHLPLVFQLSIPE